MSSQYVRYTRVKRNPRLPLEGSIDLTYRCNNVCQHCWLWLHSNAAEQRDELSFDEIRNIVDQARNLGTRSWSISGGEPMLRHDFFEIFDVITSRSAEYSLNTNGTLITPAIARLLKRPGVKMIALYGATADVYDAVTRNPGGFEALMAGFHYLREAGANFVVQLIPMRANWHQWDEMVALAKSLSPEYRVGAPWLFLSAQGSAQRNRQIAAQRLSPFDVIELDRPSVDHPTPDLDWVTFQGNDGNPVIDVNHLLAGCVNQNEFHIDPYGGMTFCPMIKHPDMRFSLRQHSFVEIWEKLIPTLSDFVRGDEEYAANCGSCDKRADCRWCAAYGYLETGRHTAPVPYLCEVADEAQRFKQDWQENHRRYFQIAGITACIESDLDLSQVQFKPELLAFRVDGPGEDLVVLRHHFELPVVDTYNFGEVVYKKPPWMISRKDGVWYYRGILEEQEDSSYHRLAVFNSTHTRAEIQSEPRISEYVRTHGWHSLSLFPTDQIWIIPLLADRQAVLIHSSAAIVNRHGMVFVGHSDAGKSTTVSMLNESSQNGTLQYPVEILCDDRNILRRWENGWRVHGTWSHGTVSDVSPSSAPLRAIFFLQQDDHNALVPVTDRKETWSQLLSTLVRSLETAEWWQKELDILVKIVDEVPCYRMHFDKSGEIVNHLSALLED